MHTDQERTNTEHPTKSMAHEALHDLVHFDKNLFRTVPVLLFKPGKLSQIALTDKQSSYVKPFALFVFINFVFFVVKAKGIFNYTLDDFTDLFPEKIKAACTDLHIPVSILAERFNTAMHFELKEYVIIMVPILALVLQLLFITQRRHYTQHLVFSLHFYSFFIVFLIVIPYVIKILNLLIGLLNGDQGFLDSELFLDASILVIFVTYLSAATRRFYNQQWWVSIAKSVVLSVSAMAIVVYIFRTFLFFVVMHSVSE